MTDPASPSIEFSESLERLIGGADLLPSELPVLSDLTRDQVQELEAAWPRIPDAVRVGVATEVVRLSDERIEVEFSRFALVALGDPLAEVRAAAVEALRESTLRVTAHRLTGVLQDDPDEEVAAGAANILGEFVLRLEHGRFPEEEGAAVVERLRAAATDHTRTLAVCSNSLEALAPRSEPWVESLIIEAYYGDEDDLRLAAVRAMGLSARESWLEFVIEQFDASDTEFRREAAIAAGEIASEDAVSDLADLFLDADETVAKAAIEAVGEIGGEVAIDELRQFAPDAPEEWAELVQQALEATAVAQGDYGDFDA